ncbi:transcriptional regulator, SARP family [Actinokineospora spheciospongiae]|uniref:Transcriptional regulator, SARP family n=1 Tax=Actinokineospora spheciospongiae TaxID=909613 RepID=W7J8N2_9PSEU|nr:transcriptional regulator, SARP family [Actinokineospora spheciospongiae]
MGKTALALHWLLGESDRFPDGQLYVDLSAHGPLGATAPVDVLGGLLRGLGVPTADLPPGIEQRSALYRSLTAVKALVVLLDDAASTAQVRPLLPASRHSAVLVTSRRRLGGLVADGARVVQLGALAPDAAVELLRRAVRPERVAAEPESAREVAVLCGGVPIALHVVAARLASRPHSRFANLAVELGDERRRLGALAAEDDLLSVAACFDLSYRWLPPAAARLYRLLGLYPGTEFDRDVVAALTGSPDADGLLDALVDANVVSDLPYDRYRFHDLLRLHARRCAERDEVESERSRALRSVVSRFLDRAVAADRVVTPLRPHLGERYGAPGAARFDTPASALDWLEREVPNLVACAEAAFARGWDDLVWQLHEALWGLFLHRGHHGEWERTGTLAIESATRCGNRAAEVRSLLQTAAVRTRTGALDEAVALYRRAFDLAGSTGDWQGQATALEGLGSSAHRGGRTSEAVDLYRRSLALSEEHGQQRGVALLLCYLGYALVDQGEHSAAIDHFRRSARIAATLADRHCHAQALVGLGAAHAAQGAVGKAVVEMEEGLASLPAAESLVLRVHVLEKLAEVKVGAGDLSGAREHWQEALESYTALGDPKAEHIRARLDALDDEPPAHRAG